MPRILSVPKFKLNPYLTLYIGTHQSCEINYTKFKVQFIKLLDVINNDFNFIKTKLFYS